MTAKHRRLFLRQMAVLQERFPCAAAHDPSARGYDADTKGHTMRCYPTAQVALVQREVTS